MIPPQKSVEVVRLRGGQLVAGVDRAATEEPLEVRLHGRPFAVIMRTPGADRELAAGFLLSEGVLQGADDLGTIDYCAEPAGAAGSGDGAAVTRENVINVTLVGQSLARLDQLLAERRQVIGNASCGLCGRLTIESLQARVPALTGAGRVSRSTIASMPERLRSRQTVFDETGGLHAAGLFTTDGELETSAEDVGRHNAVDKVIGRLLIREALPLSDRVLFVSGRTSFEIVQKALLAGIPVVAAVSAPSSLAIELALDSGLTLLGFVRGADFNIYTHPERIS